MAEFVYDLGIIGACGHVGLPLCLAFADRGLNVLGLDINEESIKKVQNAVMPFYEENSQEILERVINKKFFLSNNDSKISDCEKIIVIVGTPLNHDFSVNLGLMENLLSKLINYLKEGQTLIFRSTLAPKTTEYIKDYIETKTKFIIGNNLFLANVPERLTQSNAIKELKELPNIIGAYDEGSYSKAENLFKLVNPETIRLTPLESELAKLFTNSYRMTNFALANEYFIIAETLGANFHKVREAMNYNYPRCNLAKQGFAKGPCLGKDSWILLNSMPHFNMSTTITSAAYRINDGMPDFLLHKIKEKVSIRGKKVAILGTAFKRNTDDTRDSLSLKLINLLKNEFANYVTHDPYVDNKDIKEVLKDSDIIIIATNHEYYEQINFKDLIKKEAIVVDLWNLTQHHKFIFKASEMN